MGENAEMMLDGTCCSVCGEYMGGDEGYPTTCPGCSDEEPDYHPAPKAKAKCPQCGKVVKQAGLDDHIRVKHPS